jgi:SAM-dependent methyltransferase
MRTPIGPDNPFGHTRHGYAFEKVPVDTAAHLDVGCYEGRFLVALRKKVPGRLVGVDASAEAIERARHRYPDLELVHVAPDQPLPLPDGAFSSITLMDVLEHVYDQAACLRDLHRLLAPGGLLIVTVPQQHVFSFLDLGNFKFRFPRLHRRFCRLTMSEAAYRQRYVTSPDGLIGDIDARKGWHEHFSAGYLSALLSAHGFTVEDVDGSGLFGRVLAPFNQLAVRLGMGGLTQPIVRLDARRFSSMNLFCTARAGV